jgi:hypothetical protein
MKKFKLTNFLRRQRQSTTKKAKALLMMTCLFTLSLCSTAFAAEPIVLSGTPTIDESVFTVIINGAKAVLGLFTVFPINIFLASSILGIAIGVVRKIKKG